MKDIESQEIEPLKTTNKSPEKNIKISCYHVKVCLFTFVVLLTIVLIVILYSHIYKLVFVKTEENEIDYNKKTTIVRSGYWNDKERMCSYDKPCYMNCIEYNRFDIFCEKNDRKCIMGHYDYCRGETVSPLNNHGDEYRDIFNKMYPQ